MQTIPVFQVDSFTDKPFAGNPAAVCLLESEMPEKWMQGVAAEMNLSETAFVRKEDEVYSLRWFTPAKEVALCGHATLATAHILRETGREESSALLRFRTLSGELRARFRDKLTELDFPQTPASACDPPAGLAGALGVEPLWCGKNSEDFLLEIASERALRAMKPDFRALAGLTRRGAIVTCRPEKPGEHDFLSRFFAPGIGIDEDPVTGSAHCTLGPYWAEKLGKSELEGWQASARGGAVSVGLEGDRTLLGGHAVTVFRGELIV